MRVLLADDHRLVRAGLRALLSGMPEVAEILESCNGSEAVEMAAAHHPDIVLMDISMPGLNGIEALERIRRISSETRVVILSMHHDPHFVDEALQAGAVGYLLKADGFADLEKAVRAVARGRVYISPGLAGATGAAAKRNGGAAARLTPRQREVLQLIAQGLTNRQIAMQLGIHIKTVESHRTELMQRLGIHEVAGLVRYAIRHGLVSIE